MGNSTRYGPVEEVGARPCAELTGSAEHLGVVRHELTHRRLRLEVYACQAHDDYRVNRRAGRLLWVARQDVGGLACGRAQQKVFDCVVGSGRWQ